MTQTTRAFRAFAAACLLSTLAAAQLPIIVINEMNCDTPGTDTLEFIELYTIPNASMAGYTLVFFNGAPGVDTAYMAVDLTGTSDALGFYVVGNGGLIPAPSQVIANNSVQNGQDAVALYFNAPAASWALGATHVTAPPAGAVLVDAVVYGTDDPSATVLLATLLPGFQQINEGASSGQTIDQSIGRCPDFSPAALDTSTYVQMVPSPGAFNVCAPPFQITITQTCPGPISLTVTGAQPGYELYNLIALTCSNPAGSGILFGINADLAAGSPLVSLTLPIGSHPFHVLADANGNYFFNIATSGACPSPLHFTVEAVCVEALGLGVTRITAQTSGCVVLDL